MKMTPWRAAGVALFVCGVGLGLGSAFIFASTLERAERQEATRAQIDMACMRQLNLIGPVVDEGGPISVRVDAVEDPRTALGDATLALAFCPTRSIASFCLGSGCSGLPEAPVSMTLRLTAPHAP